MPNVCFRTYLVIPGSAVAAIPSGIYPSPSSVYVYDEVASVDEIDLHVLAAGGTVVVVEREPIIKY